MGRPPPLWLGAVNERALRAAGTVADGVLLSVLSGPAYVARTRKQVAAAGRPAPPVTAFVLASVADDRTARDAVRDAVGFFLRAESHTALVGRAKHGAEVRERVAALAEGEPLAVEDEWIDEFAGAGDPDRVAIQLRGCSTPAPTPLACGCFRPSDPPPSYTASPPACSRRWG